MSEPRVVKYQHAIFAQLNGKINFDLLMKYKESFHFCEIGNKRYDKLSEQILNPLFVVIRL